MRRKHPQILCKACNERLQLARICLAAQGEMSELHWARFLFYEAEDIVMRCTTAEQPRRAEFMDEDYKGASYPQHGETHPRERPLKKATNDLCQLDPSHRDQLDRRFS
jgi:hypothetical protein